MIIRKQQIESLEDSLTRDFEDEMRQHVQEFTPRHCKVMEEAGIREVIQNCIRKARQYGFSNRGSARLYIDLTFMLGSGFDTDPLLPWAGAILKTGSATDQMERAERLHQKALEYSNATAGPNFEYAKEAFKRARAVRYADLAMPSADLESGCVAKLREGYPKKFEYAGEAAVRTSVREALGKVGAYSISSQHGIVLFVILTFAIGHGFAEDPLFPWISRTLKNEAISDPNKRAERLYTKTMTYLEHVITNLG